MANVRLTFIQPASFAADWSRLGLTDEDLRALENSLMDRPEAGRSIVGTGGLRKSRFAPPLRHTGKSGAMRVGYLWLHQPARIYLLIIFPKNEKADLSAAERKYFRKWIEFIRWQVQHEE